MTLTDYTVKSVPADMSEAAFLGVLRDAGSPVHPVDAVDVFRYCLVRRLSPAFLLAMFHHESTYGRFGSAVETHSWGNTRPPSVPPISTGVTARTFSVYRDWRDGGISTVARLFDYAPYLGKDTVRAIIPTWAPSSDGNNVERYIAAVLGDIDRWVVPPPAPAPSPFGKFWRGLWTP